jgi:hypothetical protein
MNLGVDVDGVEPDVERWFVADRDASEKSGRRVQ